MVFIKVEKYYNDRQSANDNIPHYSILVESHFSEKILTFLPMNNQSSHCVVKNIYAFANFNIFPGFRKSSEGVFIVGAKMHMWDFFLFLALLTIQPTLNFWSVGWCGWCKQNQITGCYKDTANGLVCGELASEYQGRGFYTRLDPAMKSDFYKMLII